MDIFGHSSHCIPFGLVIGLEIWELPNISSWGWLASQWLQCFIYWQPCFAIGSCQFDVFLCSKRQRYFLVMFFRKNLSHRPHSLRLYLQRTPAILPSFLSFIQRYNYCMKSSVLFRVLPQRSWATTFTTSGWNTHSIRMTGRAFMPLNSLCHGR